MSCNHAELHASNIQARIRFSLYGLLCFRHNQLSLYVELVWFDSISSKDDLVEKSGAVRQVF